MTNNINKEIYIRRWLENDWMTLRRMRIEGVTVNGEFFLFSAETEAARDKSHWVNMLADQNKCALFGLYDRDEAIGLTGAFRWKESPEDTVILGMSYIRPVYRGRGLSAMFYESRINWAKEQDGITRIIVSHKDGNTASRAANQRWGFKHYETETITFGDGSTALDYRYELKWDLK